MANLDLLSISSRDRLVQELGGDTAALRREVGIAPGGLPPDSWISYRAFLQLLENSAHHLGCPHFGLSLARYQDIGILGTVGFVMREAPDVATALSELSKYFVLHKRRNSLSAELDPSWTALVANFCSKPCNCYASGRSVRTRKSLKER